jgi:hypothetical protein
MTAFQYGDGSESCQTVSQLEARAMSQPESAPTPEQLKQALKAFRKRLKLTRLDAESNLGGGPLSSGRDSGIVAVTPPQQFPQAVWDELVRRGKLKPAGRGTYELAED